MRAAACLAGALGALALAGCGGVRAADLFLVTRTGAGGRLTLLVDEEGGVSCDGGPVRRLSDPQLVQARALQEELHEPAAKGLVLAPRKGSVFSYTAQVEGGTVRFSDNSADPPHVFPQLALFVLQVQQGVCHLPG